MLENDSNARIKKLSPLLISQLAAGEVITRPAAVVKELLENAIDAGADHIEVHITQGGMGMIEVVDNGVGIHPDDMIMAITRHATSKVADIANLQGITTLGFRGEALAAMAAVSRLSLISSHDDSGIGRQLQVAGVLADTPKIIPIVHNQGTTVTVKDLYFNVPARRGNLKSIATEFTHIETIVREVAIARADVTLSLFHDNKRRLLLSASSLDSSALKNNSRLPLSRLEQALGCLLTDSSVEITVDLSSLVQQSAVSLRAGEGNTNQLTDKQASISGWLWPTTSAQPNATPKLLYVNGRLVKEALISNQLRQLATSAQLDNMGYALYFELPNHWLNINVHPTKQRIKISPLNNIMAHLSHSIRLKLKNLSPSQAVVKPAISGLTEQKFYSQTVYSNRPSISSEAQAATAAHRQVQSAQQQYQLSPTQQPLRNLSAYKAKNILQNERPNHFNKDIIDIKKLILPQCLSVIDDLPHKNKTVISTVSIDFDVSPLPWLLFYNQDRYLIISAQDWQKHVPFLFKLKQVNSTLYELTESVFSAAKINQLITSYSATLSAQELADFEHTFIQTLSTNAFISVNTEQLIAFMLSVAT